MLSSHTPSDKLNLSL